MDVFLTWMREQGVEFRVPQLLWAIALCPLLLAGYAWARSQRRKVAGAFRVVGARGPRRPWVVFARTLAVTLLLLGLAGLIVGFARPVVPLETARPSSRRVTARVRAKTTQGRRGPRAPTTRNAPATLRRCDRAQA